MRNKIMIILLAVILFLGGFLLYSLLRVRTMASVTHPVTENLRQTPLYRHVEHLSVRIGSRSIYEPKNLQEACGYIWSALEKLGYDPNRQNVPYADERYHNIVVTLPGEESPDEMVLVGAHYDTVSGTPGADDNASAVAVLLEIAGGLKDFRPGRTIRLVFFALEEPPVFRTPDMGSAVYARLAKERGEKIVAMVCLEMLGYYSDQDGAQTYPLPVMHLFYPARPDFIGVVGNLASRRLVKEVSQSLKRHSSLPVETLTTVSAVPGVDFSDHKPFWDEGYPAVMITDTAFYRNPNYHTERDTIDTIDFRRLSILRTGLEETIKDLAGRKLP
jgi:Zn-dependent M28 family amino/carboxypeptidase